LTTHGEGGQFVDNEYPSAPNRFLIFLFALGLFVYNTMDNMDGKQARKIGAASPLGLVMDHGCDSMNTFIQGMTFSRILMMGNIWTSISVILPIILFWFASYEQ
jgi:ethanolaminephosphotransferase